MRRESDPRQPKPAPPRERPPRSPINPSLTISSQAHTRSATHGTPAAWFSREGRAGQGIANRPARPSPVQSR